MVKKNKKRKKNKPKVPKSKSKHDSEKRTATLSVPKAKIQITYEANFRSKPVWEIVWKGLGSWAKEHEGEWKKEDFQKTPRIKGVFVEVTSKTKNDSKYVLIKHGPKGEEKWINVGKFKKWQKCKYLPKKRRCQCNYRLRYDYATSRGPQYGIKGYANLEYQGKSLDLQLIAVRCKTHQDGKMSTPFVQTGRGSYHGRVQARGNYVKKHGENALEKSLSILIYETKDEDTGKWIKGVKLGTKDKQGRPKTNKNIFIHPAHFPSQLDGCLALGRKFLSYGIFESMEDSRKAMRDVFKLIGISTAKQFKKAQNLKKPKFMVEVIDNRSYAQIEKVEGPSEVVAGYAATFKATRKKQSRLQFGKPIPIKWVVRDGKTGAVLKDYGKTKGDELKIDHVPWTWRKSETVKVFAYTVDPSDGVTMLDKHKPKEEIPVKVTSEVDKFIELVKKVEEAYPSWTGDQVLNSLRRVSIPCTVEVKVPTKTLRIRGGKAAPYTVKKVAAYTEPAYDTKVWQKMLGLGPAANLDPKGSLTQEDLEALRKMIAHSTDKNVEEGIAKDWFGYEVAIGHVLTGISAGQHRYTQRNMVREMGHTTAATLNIGGEPIDNLYATTISGDLGSSAVEVCGGRDKKYIGPGSRSTDAELIGDIDGFLIGKHLKTITGGKSLEGQKNKGIKLSEILQKYYSMCVASKICATSRFRQFSKEENMGTWKKLDDEIKNFAETFIYFTEIEEAKARGDWFPKISGGLDAATSDWLPIHLTLAAGWFKKWLGEMKLKEAKRN